LEEPTRVIFIIFNVSAKISILTVSTCRKKIFFGLLFELGFTGHHEKKLLIKIECELHRYAYEPIKPIIQKFNVFIQIFAPSPAILLSMKTGAVLERGKGRDYYDFIFLSGITEPDFGYLSEKFGIANLPQSYKRVLDSCKKTDFSKKSRNFEKLVFDPGETKKVLLF
jgi:hypothetical protein